MFEFKERDDFKELKGDLIALIIGISLFKLGINISDRMVVVGGILVTIGSLTIIYAFFDILGWIHENLF